MFCLVINEINMKAKSHKQKILKTGQQTTDAKYNDSLSYYSKCWPIPVQLFSDKLFLYMTYGPQMYPLNYTFPGLVSVKRGLYTLHHVGEHGTTAFLISTLDEDKW
jgi:hypothetical protein